MNYLVQGSAAGVLKAAMLRVSRAIKSVEYLQHIRMLSCVHDEVMYSVPDGPDPREASRILRNLMEDHDTFAVPITVDVSWSETNWADKKEMDPIAF